MSEMTHSWHQLGNLSNHGIVGKVPWSKDTNAYHEGKTMKSQQWHALWDPTAYFMFHFSIGAELYSPASLSSISVPLPHS